MAGKTFLKLKRPADAIRVFGEAAQTENGPGRAHMGLCLAHLQAGDKAAAAASLDDALEANPFFAKALLGQIRKQVDNPLAASPGTREEAALYAQTYGDVWDDQAKELLVTALAGAGRGRGPSGRGPPDGARAAEARSAQLDLIRPAPDGSGPPGRPLDGLLESYSIMTSGDNPLVVGENKGTAVALDAAPQRPPG